MGDCRAVGGDDAVVDNGDAAGSGVADSVVVAVVVDGVQSCCGHCESSSAGRTCPGPYRSGVRRASSVEEPLLSIFQEQRTVFYL